MHKSKVTAIILALIITLVIVAGCANDGTVIARVNGEKILQSELDDKIAQIKTGLTSQGYTFGDEEQDKEIMGQIQEEAKAQLIDEALIMQQAKEKGVAVGDAAVQEQLTQLKQQFGADTFKQLLTQQGLTEAKLSKEIKVQLTAEALFNKITGDVTVDEKAAKAQFDQAPEKYEQLKVAHILVAANASANEEQVKAAQTKAKDLIAKLDAGADFAALAKDNSDDTQSGAAGGVLDLYFTREDTSLVKEFVDGSFNAGAVGQYSKEPVRSDFGFHIIKVLDKKETYEELKGTLQEQMLSDAKNKTFNDFFKQAKEAAKIENF